MQTNILPHRRSERVRTEISGGREKENDFTLLQTTFIAFTETLQQYQNFLWEVGRGQGRGMGVCACVKVRGVFTELTNWGVKILGSQNHIDESLKRKTMISFFYFSN